MRLARVAAQKLSLPLQSNGFHSRASIGLLDSAGVSYFAASLIDLIGDYGFIEFQDCYQNFNS
jgi:hypothetical protein